MFGPFRLIENCIYICNTMLCKLHVSICKDTIYLLNKYRKETKQAARRTDRLTDQAIVLMCLLSVCSGDWSTHRDLYSNWNGWKVFKFKFGRCKKKSTVRQQVWQSRCFFKYWYKFNFLPICSFLVVRVTSIN